MTEVIITPSESGKTLHAQVGDVVVVRLPESPTTGFRWAIVGGPDDVLRLRDDRFELAGGGGIGGGGTRIFRLAANRGGTAGVELKLWQEWEGEKSVTDRVRVTVHVH